ncbi:hypothetical protein JTE90_026178 [Oedothorax gibbosus]|uniref:Ig-like domain-containing protein n=1 Tax=Oedothorax gibbosus TaxID=931172 RepID=A0AAV6UE15_9ARAC|nr:hypothetical protein JTE90_026178 [Oedothorax gibbosus]
MTKEKSLLLFLLVIQGYCILSYGLEIKPFHFSDNLREGLRSVVVCAVMDGDPPFNFEWSKDGRPLTNDHKSLEIKPFHFSDNLREGLRTGAMCMVVEGDPPFNFEWSKDGRPLTKDHKGLEIKPFHFSDNLREGVRTESCAWSGDQTLPLLRQPSRRFEDWLLCMVVDGDPI